MVPLVRLARIAALVEIERRDHVVKRLVHRIAPRLDGKRTGIERGLFNPQVCRRRRLVFLFALAGIEVQDGRVRHRGRDRGRRRPCDRCGRHDDGFCGLEGRGGFEDQRGHWSAVRRRIEGAGERDGARMALGRIVVHGTREHGVDDCRHRRLGQHADPRTGSRGALARQQLEGDRRQREHVSGGAPAAAVDAFRRAVRPAHRRPDADLFQRFDDAEPGGARLVGCYKDVARMQTAVPDALGAREVDGAGELRDKRQHLLDRRGRVMPHRDVQRLGGHVLLGPERERAFDAGLDGLDDRWMHEARVRRAAQRRGQHVRLLGHDVEPEDLDRDKPVAGGFIGAENGTKSTNTNLMQHPEGSECRRGRECAWILSGQRRNSSGRSRECSTNRGILSVTTRVSTGMPCLDALTAFRRL